MRDLLPSNISSNAYTSDIAKRIHKNNEKKKDFNKKYKVFFPKYEGKIYDPTLSKTIKILEQNEEQIKKEIHKRNNNINLLKNELLMNNVSNIHDLEKEKRKLEERIRLIEKEKNLFMEKLEELRNRRNSMQFQYEKELGILENNKKIRFKKFLDDLNNKEKNEIIEEKIMKLQDDSKKIQLKMKEDLKEVNDRKNYEIEKMEKENEEKIQKYRKEMKEKEKEDIKRRNQKAKEQLFKLKDLINKKPVKTTFIYQEHEKNYLKKEENLIKKENKKRKQYMKHIDLNEIHDFAKNYDEKKSQKLIESNLKMEKEKEIWSKRSKLIPNYINPWSKLVMEDEKKMKQEEEKENLERKKFKELQKNFKVPKPLIIVKEIKDIKDKEIKFKKHLLKSNSYSDIIREKMKTKLNSTKNKNEKKEENNKNINNNIINFKLPLICIKKKNEKINKSFEKKKNNQKNELITDYLNQRRLINEKNREKKRNIGELSKLDYNQTNNIRKLIKENGMDENILKMAKSQLESLEEKKKQKSLLLKLNGGIENKPELVEEICDLMIDSIQARLSIIKEIENLDDQNNVDNNDMNQNEEQNENQEK